MKKKPKRTKAAAGKLGGTARAKRMTAAERSESARQAAQARWWSAKQEVLKQYPKAFCFKLAERKAYQIAIPVGNGMSEGLSGIFSSPRWAWEDAWVVWMNTLPKSVTDKMKVFVEPKENKGQ